MGVLVKVASDPMFIELEFAADGLQWQVKESLEDKNYPPYLDGQWQVDGTLDGDQQSQQKGADWTWLIAADFCSYTYHHIILIYIVY
jgi:hypothetical protein